MAYTKIMPIRTSSHLQKAFEYIENPDKTTEKVYVSSYLCDSRTAVEDFREIQRLARNGGNNYAQHIIQSFSTEDKITPEKALEIGEELIRRMFPEHQYVIAVHSDTEHIHVHTILNSVNFYTHKKLRSNIGTVYKLRQISDELCAENGLIVIDKTFKNIRKRMKEAIDRSINEANSFYEFLELMQRRQYEIRYDEHLSFKLCGYDQYFRVDTLGTAYKDIAIHRRCANHTEVENKRIQPYMKHFTPSTHKSRLKSKIDWGMRECKSFDELLEYLKKQGIEVKQGKHLAIKPKDGQRFRRIEKLGEQYTEEMLHLYFEDRKRYSIRKAKIDSQFGRLLPPHEKYGSRYIAVENINTQIRMMNFMSEHGIKTQADLLEKIDKAKHRIEVYERDIQDLCTQGDKLKTVISAEEDRDRTRRIYRDWQSMEDNSSQKEIYRIRNYKEIYRYQRAEAVLNHYKLKDPVLLDWHERNQRVRQHNENMEEYKKKLQDEQDNLRQYEILYENLRYIAGDKPEIEEDTPEIEEEERTTRRSYNYWDR